MDAAFGEMFGATADEGSLEGWVLPHSMPHSKAVWVVSSAPRVSKWVLVVSALVVQAWVVVVPPTVLAVWAIKAPAEAQVATVPAQAHTERRALVVYQIGGQPIIMGALDKSLIDAVIKRNMNQIRYCYQRELTKNPSLGGKIVVKFTIAKDGSVSKTSIKSSSMGNKKVESCIAGRFMQFKFPEPKGGGIVIVSYPFIFAQDSPRIVKAISISYKPSRHPPAHLCKGNKMTQLIWYGFTTLMGVASAQDFDDLDSDEKEEP